MLLIRIAQVLPEPEIVSFVVGLSVPIPNLPSDVIRIDSTPPSVKAMVSAAGKNIPVLVSPDVVIDGAETVPALNVDTPVTVKLVKVTEPPSPNS